MSAVASESDERVTNNTMRHQYRTLSDEEKVLVVGIKDKGAEFLALLDGIEPSREVELARVRLEEAVFWAVKHVTR